MPKVSVSTKGPAPDASMRTAFLRKKAIVKSQLAKNPTEDQTQKPLISEHHLTKGYENGVIEYKVGSLKLLGRFY